MKKLFLFTLLMFAPVVAVWAQDDAEEPVKTWTTGGAGALTFNQVGLYNWAAGGQSNLTLIGNLNLFANRKWERGTWENSLDLAYGFIKNNYRFAPDTPISKAEDKIEFTSKYGTKAFSDKFQYSGLLTFRTQFDYGRDDPFDQVYISRALSPAYIILAAGLDYKPNDKFSAFLSPISGKVTIVTDDSLSGVGAFGVNQINPETGDMRPGSGTNVRMEFGATFRAKLKTDIMENISLESNLELFSNYIDRPQNVDMRWTNAIVAKINKYIAVNFFTDMIYDHDVDVPRRNQNDGSPIFSINPEPMPAPFDDGTYWPLAGFDFNNPTAETVTQVQRKGPILQFKEVFGVGFSYKF
ncbi:MAG: DUF3078 domain-containing protein [Bacteroidota bacterium]